MKDYLKLLLSFLSKVHNKKEDEIAALIFEGDIKDGNLKSDALDILTSEETKRVKSLKAPDKTSLDAAEKKGHDATVASVRQFVKETFGFDSDAELATYFEDLKTTVESQNTGTKAAVVTEDDVKKSKAYRDLKSAHGDEIKNLTKTMDEKYNKRELEIKRKEVMHVVNKTAKTILDGMKPLLPEDAAKAERQIQLLLLDSLHNGFDYEVENPGTEQEKIIPKKDGKPVENNLSHIVDFKTHVEGIAKQNFIFPKADPKNAGGDPTKDPAKTGGTEADKEKGAKFKAWKSKLAKPANVEAWMKTHEEIENDKELSKDERSDLQIELKNLHKAPAPSTA